MASICRWCLAVLLPLLLLSPLCLGQGSQAVGHESLELVSGDVTLAAMVNIQSLRNEDDCGDYDVDTLKEVTAVQWFINALNANNYIPGVKIGLEAYRTCQSGGRATRNTVSMLEKYKVLETVNNYTTQPLLGLLGPGRTEEAIMVSRFLSSLPSPQRPLLISGSATGAALADRNLYSNFFRVIPPDSTQVQVLVKLLQAIGWNYIAIVYDDDAYGQAAAKELMSLAESVGVCVPSFTALPLDARSKDFIDTADAIANELRGSGSGSVITGIVFIGSTTTAQKLLELLESQVTFTRFIFSEALGLQTSVVEGKVVGKGALAAAPPYLPLPEFRAFWNSIWTNWTVFLAETQNNVWLKEYFETFTSCSASDANCWSLNRASLPLINDDTQWLFEYYQVKAAAVFAAILKQLHSSFCNSLSGPCLSLKALLAGDRGRIEESIESNTFNLQQEFQTVSSIFIGQTKVGFGSQGEITSGEHNGSLYDVFNYRQCQNSDFCFRKVGTYKVDGTIDLDTQSLITYTESGQPQTWPNITKSQCVAGRDCLICLPSDLPDHVILVPGDIYVVAVVPVHDRTADSPLQCGDIRVTDGADIAHSVLFAVNEINKKRAPFNGIFGTRKLGVIILNSCSRELVIKERLIALHKGRLMLPDGRNTSHIVNDIAGYVGAFFSSVSVAMYEVLSNLDTRFVMVSPSNTSPELSDRSKYPLYLRLTSGSDSQVIALLNLVRDLGHQYVQVIYDPDDVYTAAIKESINRLTNTSAFNICVVNNIVSHSGEQSFYPVLDNLRKNSWATLVVVTLQVTHTKLMMRDILPEMTSSDKFRFLGTDAWARNKDILTVPNAERLLGSLTFSFELPLNQKFADYLRETDPLDTNNPWLKYFWEARKNCYFDGSFQKKDKNGQCPADLVNDYTQSSWMPFYIDAVEVFALGLHQAMQQHCGQASLCTTLTSQHLVAAMKNVRLDLFGNGIDVNVFNDNGDGDVGFSVFQVSFDVTTPDSNDLTYTKVGRYDHSTLSLSSNDVWILKNLPTSQCPNPDACTACFSDDSDTTPSPQTGDDEGVSGAVIGLVVVVVILVIALVVLIVFLVLTIRRQRAARAEDREKIGLENRGLSLHGSDSRPLPPIREGSSSRESSGDGRWTGSNSSANQYDYLDPVTRTGRHSYLQPTNQPGSTSGSASGSAHTGSTRLSIPVNSEGCVTRDSDGRFGYQHRDGQRVAGHPYDLARHVPENRTQMNQEGGRENSLPVAEREMESRPVVMQGGLQNSRAVESDVSGGSVRPIEFENSMDDDRDVLPPPEPCGSPANSGYLRPVSEDYLTPTSTVL